MNAPFSFLPLWELDKEKIVNDIIRRPGYLKILIKVRNELHFLMDWMAHHADIVGYGNIVIFDNWSDDPALAEYYRSLPDAVTISRYQKIHNMLHVTEEFPELYDALSKSTTYFTFLDCDEYLVYIDSNIVVNRNNIVDALKNDPPYSVFPGTWLENGICSRTLYDFRSSFYLGEMLANGKPIIRSSAGLSGWLLHNYHIQKSFWDKNNLPKFFVQHRLNLYPDKRIEANIVKLVTETLIPERWPLEKILDHDFSHETEVALHRYVNDIKRLHKCKAQTYLDKGYANMKLGTKVEFFSATERDAFYEFRHPWDNNFVQRFLGAK